jgi:fructose-bisphosphate aldolase/2-amino-3,7-dideoxy-D-threo-hept-6-ulosonate synthase
MIMHSNYGKVVRFSRIFKRGRTFIVAMDHGLESGVVPGLEKMRDAVEKVLVEGVDAVMVSFGAAKHVIDVAAGRASLIITIPEDEKFVLRALKMGADAVKTTYFGQIPLAYEKLYSFSKIARACEEYGLPYLIELVPVDSSGKVIYDVSKVITAARIGAEIGGDFVKIPYTGVVESFKLVVESCFKPVVIMGGPKAEDEYEVLKWVEGCVKAGGAGVAFGRNVWQHKDPSGMARAIGKIIHMGLTAQEALKEIKSS